MVVPLVFFLFFHLHTASARIPRILDQLNINSNPVDAICNNVADSPYCLQVLRELNLNPTKISKIGRTGTEISKYARGKAVDTSTYIETLKKQYPYLNPTLQACSDSYQGLINAFAMTGEEIQSKDYATIDYDLHVSAVDNFHCPDDQFTSRGFHESPLAARNHEVMTLSDMLTHIGILLDKM
ncbi:hypothetical protein NE237_014843 [Protea cynaroides]|uniref:Pectinesterase inhibitor domain-containing protein n=1 Tax=Protea cynaroides TaxID=273540 RepID=A0A9Q0QQG8_9MAGN|nr:hypothetical protein NE237_014843 [Protea cynaroides]